MISDPEVKREIDLLLQGRTQAASSFSLATGVATTTVVKTGVSSNSAIFTQAYSVNASNADIIRIVPAKDQFVVTHTVSGSERVHRYECRTGLAT